MKKWFLFLALLLISGTSFAQSYGGSYDDGLRFRILEAADLDPTSTPEDGYALVYDAVSGLLEFAPGGSSQWTGTSGDPIYYIQNVGIGTSAPTQALDVDGQIRMRTGASNTYVLTSDANGVGSWAAITSAGTKFKSFSVTNPVAVSALVLPVRAPANITIVAVHALVVGGTNVVGHLMECDANGGSCAGIDGATDMTITTSNTNDDGTLSNPSIDSGDYMAFRITSVSGTVTQLLVTFEYTE